jgi:hypothetical protein
MVSTSLAGGRLIGAWIAGVLGVVVLPLAIAVGITAAVPGVAPGDPDAARVVSAADLADEYGIRITLVAVTADGGLVDLRFNVLDSVKAAHLIHDAAQMPALYVESSHTVLRAPRPMAHKMTLLDGATYFVLYPNSGGAVQPGTEVSVVVDDIRLPPVVAAS